MIFFGLDLTSKTWDKNIFFWLIPTSVPCAWCICHIWHNGESNLDGSSIFISKFTLLWQQWQRKHNKKWLTHCAGLKCLTIVNIVAFYWLILTQKAFGPQKSWSIFNSTSQFIKQDWKYISTKWRYHILPNNNSNYTNCQ